MDFITSLEESITFLVNKNYDLKTDLFKNRQIIEEECRKNINKIILQKTEKVDELELNLKKSVDSNMSIIKHLRTRIEKERFFVINKEIDFIKYSECGVCYSETNVFKTCKCSGLLCTYCFHKIKNKCPFCREPILPDIVLKMKNIYSKYFVNLHCTEKCMTPKAKPPLNSPPRLRRTQAFRYSRNLLSEIEEP